MILLRVIQAITFRRSQGVIFLSQYSKRKTLTVIGNLAAPMAIIPHGLNRAFIKSLKERREITFYTPSNPLRVLYVSNIDVYKHQKPVLLAIQFLVAKGYPIKISFIGPGPKNEIDQFIQFQKKVDPKSLWSEYLGQIPYEEIHTYYDNTDLAIFASSCETFGITLLEKMASGIPVACSNKSSMSELLKEGGLYFDPEDSLSIANTIEKYLQSPELRIEKQKIAQLLAQNYSWEDCAKKTFNFLSQATVEYKK
jgi:glycosyltransferase involved in cell wall biosynthesis